MPYDGCKKTRAATRHEREDHMSTYDQDVHDGKTQVSPRPQARVPQADNPYAGGQPYEGNPYADVDQPRVARRQQPQGAGRGSGSGTGSGRGSGMRRPHLPSGKPRHGCLSLLLWLVMVPTVALMWMRTIPLEDSTGPAIPELVSFIPLLFIPVAIVVVLALLWRRYLLVIVSAASLGLLLFWHWGYFVPSGRLTNPPATTQASSPSTSDSYLRLMTLSADGGRASATEVVRAVREEGVEVLAMQEVSWALIDELEEAGLTDILPNMVQGMAGNHDNGGINCLWFRASVSNPSDNLLDIDTSAMSAGSIQVGGKTLRFVSAHPNSPVRNAQALWSEGLNVLEQLSSYDHNYVIMGDFNATWNHAAFRALLGTTFVDAGEQAGEWFHMTFPSNMPIPPLIEIDHIVYTKGAGLFVGKLATRSIPGTDHQALLGTMQAS